jgi:hypothetical protein
MAAATSARPVSQIGTGAVPALKSLPMAADTTIYPGTIVVTGADGYAIPAEVDTGLIAHGVAIPWVDGSGSAYDNSGGAAGAKKVQVQAGCYLFENSSAADAIAATEVGAVCYLVDDQTVAKTDGSAARSPAGYVWGLEGTKVAVYIPGHAIAIPA